MGMKRQRRPRRRSSALTGAAVACALVLGVVVLERPLSPSVWVAAFLSLMVGWLLSPPRADGPSPDPDAPGARSLFDTAASLFPDPAILVDRRGVVAQANDAARAVLSGLKERQPLAFALRDPGVLDQIPIVAASGASASVEFGGRLPTEPVYEVRLRRLPGGADAGPGQAAVALFLRDLSAERRLERMRVDFVANVSHELRTPLASLSGLIDTLRGSAREDVAARDRFLVIMQAQAARMTRLIDDLLQLSRVELKEHQPPAHPVDLGMTVAHMVEVMTPLARDRQVTIALALSDIPLVVPGDRDELLRLVENLVENAIKYGGEGGRVDIAVRPVDRGRGAARAELEVRDHGPGISSEHLPRLTERFYRVDVAESRGQGGTGLGLAIVKHIVVRHRGRLWIESEPGKGATFRVQLPLAADEAVAVT